MNGTHTLSEVSLDHNDYSCTDSLKPTMREGDKFQYITIKTALCSIINVPNCATNSAIIATNKDKVILDVSNVKLSISGVIFDGANSLLSDTCTSGARCEYCPYFTTENKGTNSYVTDDRGEVYKTGEVTYATNCADFNALNFISVENNGALDLKNVKFTNFRQQFKSLISAEGAVSLESTDFDNVQTSPESVISCDCQSQEMTSCTFSYSSGSVTRLNNGYEYRTGLSQRGFLSITKYNSVTISSVSFSKNLVIKSTGISDSLIYIRATNLVTTLSEITFSKNVASSSLLALDYSELSYSSVTLDSQGYSTQHTQTHLQVSKLQFSNNSCNIGMYVTEASQSINSSINFSADTNLVYDALLKLAKTEKIKDSDIYGDSYSLMINNKKTTVKTKPYLSTITATVTNSITTNGLVCGDTLPNVQMSASAFKNGPIDNLTIYSVSLQYFIVDTDIYLKNSITRDPVKCGYVVNMSFGYSFNATSSSWSDYICTDGYPGIYLKSMTGPTAFTSLTFSTMTSSKSSGAAIAGLLGSNILSVADCTFNSISCSAIIVDSQDTLTVTSSTFDSCKSSDSVVVVSASTQVTLSNLAFTNINSSQSMIVYIEPSDSFLSTKLSSLSFKGISSTALMTCIFIDGAVMHLDWSDLVFDGLKTYSNSLIYMSSSTKLSSSSTIKRITAKNIVETSGYSALFYMAGGALTVSDSSFSSFKGNILIASELVNDAQITFSKCTFTGIDAAYVISMTESTSTSMVNTVSCSFVDNTAMAVKVSSAWWTDNASTIRNNKKGGIFASSGTFNFVETQFLSNNNSEGGGALQLTYKCSFNCTSCYFDSNSASTGGAIRLDQSSIIALKSSTFTSNNSTSGGSAIYIISSKMSNSIEACTFTNNKAETSGTILLIESALIISNSNFTSNIVGTSGGGVSLNSATLTCSNCSFADMSAYYGSFALITTSSVASFSSCSFNRGSTTSNGGGFYVTDSSLTINTCTGSSIVSSSKGGLMAMLGER